MRTTNFMIRSVMIASAAVIAACGSPQEQASTVLEKGESGCHPICEAEARLALQPGEISALNSAAKSAGSTEKGRPALQATVKDGRLEFAPTEPHSTPGAVVSIKGKEIENSAVRVEASPDALKLLQSKDRNK